MWTHSLVVFTCTCPLGAKATECPICEFYDSQAHAVPFCEDLTCIFLVFVNQCVSTAMSSSIGAVSEGSSSLNMWLKVMKCVKRVLRCGCIFTAMASW